MARRTSFIGALAALSAGAWLGALTPASAAEPAQGLASCLAKSTGEADRTALMRMLFVAVAADPALKPLAAVSPEQTEAFTRGGAGVVQRLLTVDCRREAALALRSDGQEALGIAFKSLGEATVRDLLTNPATASALRKVLSYLDRGALIGLALEGASDAGAPK